MPAATVSVDGLRLAQSPVASNLRKEKRENDLLLRFSFWRTGNSVLDLTRQKMQDTVERVSYTRHARSQRPFA